MARVTKARTKLQYFSAELWATVLAIKSGSLGTIPTIDRPGQFGAKVTKIQLCDCGDSDCDDRWVVYADELDETGQPIRCFVQSVALDFGATTIEELITLMEQEEVQYAKEVKAAQRIIPEILALVSQGKMDDAWQLEFDGGEAISDLLVRWPQCPELTAYTAFTVQVADRTFVLVGLYQQGQEAVVKQKLLRESRSVQHLYEAIKDQVVVTVRTASVENPADPVQRVGIGVRDRGRVM